MSTSELETPTVSAFVGTHSPELESLQLLQDQATPTSGARRRTISDSRYAAARVGVDFLSTCLALVVALPFLAMASHVPTNSIYHFWGNIGANSLFPSRWYWPSPLAAPTAQTRANSVPARSRS